MKRRWNEVAARRYWRLIPPPSSTWRAAAERGTPDAASFEDEEATAAPPSRAPGGWKTIPYIIGNETLERVASYGVTANLTLYLAERFNMARVTAANHTNVWNGAVNFAPLVGAFLADAYLGKFWTLALGSLVTFLGTTGMTLTAAIPGLSPPPCAAMVPNGVTGSSSPSPPNCVEPTGLQMGVLLGSLVLLAVGGGGVRPCGVPFGMDQFDRTTEAGRRGTTSFFNWYYATSTAAAMAALTVVVYLQDSVGWAPVMAVLAVLMLLALVLFLLGAGHYAYVAPEGSAITGIVQVFVAAYRKRSLPLPASTEEQEVHLFDPPVEMGGAPSGDVRLPLTQQLSFLNKAAIKQEGEVEVELLRKEGGRPSDPWSLCSVQQVEEAKCLIRIVPMWAGGIICMVSMGQVWTFAVLQALTMDRHMVTRHFQVPAASMGVVTLLSIVVFLPFYDRILVPLLRKATRHASGITQLQRMGAGNFVSALAMVVAGLVEGKRRIRAVVGVGPPPSVAWLLPQLVLAGVGEALNAVGQVELYNQEFPEKMRSVATSFFYLSMSASSYLSTLVVALVKSSTGKHGEPNWLDNNLDEGRLDYFYYLLAGMGFANLLYFLVCSHSYQYKGTGGRTRAPVGVDGRREGTGTGP